MKRLIIADTETGGLDPQIAGLTEIAAVIAEYDCQWNCQIVDKFAVLIKPVYNLVYSEGALTKQHRTLQQLEREGYPESEALRSFADFIARSFPGVWKGDIRLHLFNSAFDFQFLFNAYKRNGHEWPPFSMQHTCVMQLFRNMHSAGLHCRKKANLDEVCQHYGIQIAEDVRHTAWADCAVTAEAYGYMWRDLARVQLDQLEVAA